MTVLSPAYHQPPRQDESERAKQKGVVPILEKVKGCSEVPAEFLLGFTGHPSLLERVLEGEWFSRYLAPVNKAGVSDGKGEGRMNIEWPSSSVCLITK